MYNFGKRVTWTACRDCFDGHLPVKKPPIVSDPQLSPPGAKKKILFYRLSTLKKLPCVCCGSLPLVRHKKWYSKYVNFNWKHQYIIWVLPLIVAYAKDYRSGFLRKKLKIWQTIAGGLTFTKQVSSQLRDIINFLWPFRKLELYCKLTDYMQFILGKNID